MHQVHFIIPDPHAFPSGGNVYNARIIEALTHAGVHVSHDTFHPEWTLSSPDTIYLLDSYYFDQIDTPKTQIPTNCVGLVHHLNSLYPWSPEQFDEKERTVLEPMSGYLVSSSFTQHFLVSHGLERQKITVVEPAPSLTRKAGVSDHREIHALMLGSCIPRKGVLPFLEALVSADVPPCYTLTIAGNLNTDPEYAARCTAIVMNNESLNTCVRILGEQDQKAIHELYHQANLFLSASYMETFGMAIQDAVVCGLPVLALVGGYATKHIQPGVNGYRCETPDHLARVFKECVADSDNFRTLREASRTYLPEYKTWDQGAATLISKWLGHA